MSQAIAYPSTFHHLKNYNSYDLALGRRPVAMVACSISHQRANNRSTGLVTCSILHQRATYRSTGLFYTCEVAIQQTYSYVSLGRGRNGTRRPAMDPSSGRSRHLASFQSTIWGDHFLSYTSQLTEIVTQEKLELEELKEKVRKILVETPDNSTEKLILIDIIQRLGVAYHFDNEIETSIQNIFDASQLQSENDENLFIVALRFRLVRQQGHYMSSDVFKQFQDHDGNFMETLSNDVQGFLSLYEASHFRLHGEEILEDAFTFTTTHIKSVAPNLNNSLKVQVTEALSHPIRKTVPRVGARKYISIYENMEMHNNLLLTFAKLDFNVVQKMHQRELNELTRWWKDLDFANKLPYARDRLVECYMWIFGIYFEPQYSRARKMLTKVICLSSIFDDTYDAYATFDELVLFTEAVERWEASAMDTLPPYLRHAYQALLDVYHEIEEELTTRGESNRIYYAKYEMKKLVKAYFKEAQWLNAGYTPKCEEYMKNGNVSCICMMLSTSSVVLMEEFITKEIFEWMINEPLIVRASSAINRFMDDMGGHEVEQQREHVASIVECYMNEYGLSKQEAYAEIRKEITNSWKDINEEIICSSKVPMFVLERVLKQAQLVDFFFKEGDGYTNCKTKFKEMITLLFVESIC
ncbi:(-)-germacrene D synthase [Capsicum baccatum]|uniref:(-)-germacrene D synthase n=1 Tax=Capsicum baccatum TaxID=33114 RepID=A0A2G2WJK2_CAPBA|nr:(-)-germacrene D synthase [Capsicum baccatum]